MTPVQLDGKCGPLLLSLPAEATIARVIPCASTALTDAWKYCEHGPGSPRLMLMTCAGLALTGAAGTATPPAHARPSATSVSSPKHLPSTRTGTIFAFQSTPVIHRPLSAFAAMTPITDVPCHELSWTRQPAKMPNWSDWLTQSPGSDASLSR